MSFKVVEKFVSINGEGMKAGELAVFIRFAGCNLDCSYCDTRWANSPDAGFELMDEADILEYIRDTGVTNVTLTGGEPLLQEGMGSLLGIMLSKGDMEVEIETNGSIDLKSYDGIRKDNLTITMDYKLPSSRMEDQMIAENFNHLTSGDTIKFVAGSEADLERANEIINEFALTQRCNVYLSPVFNEIEAKDMVEYMKSKRMNKVKLQIQMHKVLWDHNERGV